MGAFFIVYYPGETDDTVLDTLRFAGSLPLDYLGLTMPYPLPGTALAERLGEPRARASGASAAACCSTTPLTFDAGVSATKMRFAIVKGHVQFELKRRLGRLARRWRCEPSRVRPTRFCGACGEGRLEGEARAAPLSACACSANAAMVSAMRRRSQSASNCGAVDEGDLVLLVPVAAVVGPAEAREQRASRAAGRAR